MTFTVNKSSASDWIIGGTATTANGAQTFTAGTSTTVENTGTGSGTTPVACFCDDQGTLGAGNGTLTVNDTTSKTWTAVGVDLKLSAAAAAVQIPARNLVGVGMWLPLKARGLVSRLLGRLIIPLRQIRIA
jgi:hypothetical protein